MEKESTKKQSVFNFNRSKNDTLVSFGFLYFKNEDDEIQCIDLIEECVLSVDFSQKISTLNKYQKRVMKFWGFGDFRNQLAKAYYNVQLKDWPKVIVLNKNSKKQVEFEVINTKSDYYKYLTKFDLRFTKFQYYNFKNFKNYIKLNFMNINAITPENMVIFEEEIRKAVAFGISSYARNIYSKFNLFSDIKVIKTKIEKAKNYANKVINSRKECANLDLVEELKNNVREIDGSNFIVFKKLYNLC